MFQRLKQWWTGGKTVGGKLFDKDEPKRAPRQTRGRRKGFPVRLTKQQWNLLRLMAPQLGIDAEGLLPSFEPGALGTKTARVQASQVDAMRRLLEAALPYFTVSGYGASHPQPNVTGRALEREIEKLKAIDLPTLLGDVARHEQPAEMIAPTACDHKARYTSKAAARSHLRKMRGGFRARIYRCPDCGDWHVTNHEKAKKGKLDRPRPKPLSCNDIVELVA